MLITILCLTSFAAGLIDSIVGGGGLIQIPVLFMMLPTLAPAFIFGTNKLAMMAGTAVALMRFLSKVQLPWAAALPAALIAALGAYLGARTVSVINPVVLKPLILVLLVLVAIYTYRHKNFGQAKANNRSKAQKAIIGLAIGLVIGFYDGFFGPGTGSFLIFAFVSLLGFEFLVASASAKLVNVFTNLTPVIYFASNNQILFDLALPMAACNVLGSLVGTHLAFAKGNTFIRKLFLGVVILVILRFAYDVIKIM